MFIEHLLCARTSAKPEFISLLLRNHSIIICILEMRKLRHWEVNGLAWGLTGRK